MRAAYWLASLTYEQYMELCPARKSKCESEGRDFESEFAHLQSWLRSIVGREPLGLFEPKGPHFHKEPVVDKSWNSVPVGQSLPGYFSQPC